MAEPASVTTMFNDLGGFIGHLFSPTMIFMMAAMALPVVAAAAPAGGATFGGLITGVVQHYGVMFTAPFTDGGVLLDAFSNAADGRWVSDAASIATPMMDHSMHHGMHH